VEAAGSLLKAHINRRTIGVGLSTPGFIDPRERTILFSSATASSGPLSLAPAFEPAGRLPVVLENDMHALAARWLLTRLSPLGEDVLLIYFDDAQVGAAMLIDGRPNRGCVTGANEIGHTRFPVETDECYCGRSGCLERICSTAFVRRIGSDGQTLAEVLADPRGDVARRVVDLLAAGFANVVNFTRANRLVLVSDLLRQASFARLLLETTRSLVLREIESRLRIDLWDQPSAHPGENAGWLALANLYYEGWNR
jgi:glucokinase